VRCRHRLPGHRPLLFGVRCALVPDGRMFTQQHEQMSADALLTPDRPALLALRLTCMHRMPRGRRTRAGLRACALPGTLSLATELCRLVENAFDLTAVDVESAGDCALT
jgi:hypothetical protein